MRTNTGRERGQVFVVGVLALVTLLATAALVMDLGFAWYGKRQLQASVDASAAAAAQELPDVASALSVARQYHELNKPGTLQNVSDPTLSVGSWTNDGGWSANGALRGRQNAIQVSESAQAPATFARVFGIDHFDVSAQATACQPCSTSQFDIVVALDRTGSMCDNADAASYCTDLNFAKDGIRTLLQAMDPENDQIGFVAFPPLPSDGTDMCAPVQNPFAPYDFPNGKYVVQTPVGGFRTGTELNAANGLVRGTEPGGSSTGCILPGGQTSYATALEEAQATLAAVDASSAARAAAPDIIIFMTDGEANIGPVWNCASAAPGDASCVDMPADGDQNTKPCQTAVNAASTIKTAGTTIYAIGYDLKEPDAPCYSGTTSGQHRKSNNPEADGRTAKQTLEAIASPGNFYNKPNPGDMSAIFNAIAADITNGTSRLVG